MELVRRWRTLKKTNLIKQKMSFVYWSLYVINILIKISFPISSTCGEKNVCREIRIFTILFCFTCYWFMTFYCLNFEKKGIHINLITLQREFEVLNLVHRSLLCSTSSLPKFALFFFKRFEIFLAKLFHILCGVSWMEFKRKTRVCVCIDLRISQGIS